MIIENLSRPGDEPTNGDTIRKMFPNGAEEITTYSVPAVTTDISIPTVAWLRSLGDAELSIRKYATGVDDYATDVKVFMDMVRDRASDVLIVSDADYATGITMLFRAGLLDTAKATELLDLGNHDASVLLI